MDHEQELSPQVVPVARGSSLELEPLSLVLTAVGIDHWQDPASGSLLVAEADTSAAQLHLALYRQENQDWPSQPPVARSASNRGHYTALLMLLLAGVYVKTGPWSAHSIWFTQGAMDNAAVFATAHWWRPITALTLHADLSHLLGNCLIGGLILHLLGRVVGYGQAWLLTLLAGAAGNLCNGLLRQAPHLSVGFSTSVFAAIGLLTGLQLAGARSFRALLLPLGAGAGLLSLLGSEGARTDLGAHLFGLLNGLAFGWVGSHSGLIDRLRLPALQLPLLLLTLFFVCLAWMRALS